MTRHSLETDSRRLMATSFARIRSILAAAGIAVALLPYPSIAALDSSALPSSPSKTPKLFGRVEHDVSPFREDGSTETIPEGTPLQLTVTSSLNSELAQNGDPIRAVVSADLKDSSGNKILLPGKWEVVGHVSRVEGRKRLGRDGYIEIKFDKLVSPDGKWEVPLDASASTKESTAKTVVKQAATTTGYAAVGAIGGSIISVQLTGIPLAVATHGLSVAAGAALGGTVGVAAALRRKGDILCAFPGDEINIRLPAPIVLPGFKQEIVPSKAPIPKMEGLNIIVKKYQFNPFPFGDKKSRLLSVTFLVENHTNKEYSFGDFAVVCNRNHSYLPYADTQNFKQRLKKVGPNAVQEATITFQVGAPRLKYSLVLLEGGRANILSQVAIN